MIEFVTSPKGEIASDVFDVVKKALGVVKASQWMFTANAWFNGRSPMQAIREGDGDAVKAAAGNVKKPPAVKDDTVPEWDELCPF